NNLVSLLNVPVEFFLGLSDPVCIPPFVYSPYAHTTAPKQIVFSPFTPHNISREYKEKILRDFAAL
ncbi:acetylxylan esterase, partial [Cutibacterium acnes subsp. acnes]|nr:acetylxylan esterase [Cutibacterium acnes subsp. acnes]